MKRTILAVFAVLLALPVRSFVQRAYAVDKGSVIVGGSASFTSLGGKELRGEERTTVITLDPSFSYFVAPHVAIGAALNLVSISGQGESDTFVGIGPTVSYFFGNQDSKAYPFLSGSFVYSSSEDAFTKTDFPAVQPS